MMKQEQPTEEVAQTHGSAASYTVGFLLSVMLTVMPFLIVYYHTMHGVMLIGAIVVFALLQLFIQLQFFMHLGQERGPRWRSMAFIFMGIVVLTIVVGSLWIMHNLSYNMTPEDIRKQLLKQNDI
jgi:cytochrome o ubiquinol oxidase operon protein cyoD